MSYNLAPINIITAASGSKSITENELEALSDSITDSGGPSIAATETLIVECDLKARYNLDDAFYHRTAATTETITVSVRQSNNEDWKSLPYTDNGSVLSIALSGTEDRYRFFRVQHYVSDGTATAHELEIFSSDEEILYGSSGQYNNFDIGSGVVDIVTTSVDIYNTDSVAHDIYVLLDGDDTDSLSLELSSDGNTYYELYETGKSIPSTFSWASGSFSGTEVSGDTVTLVPSSGTGAYYTPVLDLDGIEGRRLFWKATVSGTSKIDESSLDSNVPTISIRQSNTAPESPWTDGQISNDSNWSLVSGTLPFESVDNNTILEPRNYRYFQACVQLTGGDDIPVLEAVGIEEGLKLSVPPKSSEQVYVRVTSNTVSNSGLTNLITWYLEDRTIQN